jgi:hypothetical protein
MTDASRNMTALEASALGGFKVTGTWTANRTLTMPSGRFQFVAVENATTGGFSLILCGVSGTCLTIPNGQTATGVWYDGTNMVGTTATAGGVSTVSVVPANGFTGSVANPGTTPAITLAVDSNHVLPVNTGPATAYLNESGNYSTPAGGITCLSGDVTTAGSGCTAATLATVNSTPACHTFQTTDAGGVYACFTGKGLNTVLGTPFSITSFTCSQCGNFELGYSITTASGTASYANPTVPTSASVSDGTNTDTPMTPFTSWVLNHTYTNATFTLTALGNSQTQTAQQVFNATFPCTFYGLSTGAAPTGATASGTSNNQCGGETSTLAGGLGILANYGIGTTQVGQTFTFASPGGNYVSILATESSSGCNHTWAFGTSSSGPPVTGSTHAITNYPNILGGVQPFMCIYTFGPYSSNSSVTVAQ